MLTDAQRATLLAAIKSDATANALRSSGDVYSLQLWCNGSSTTDAWRTAVTPQQSDEAATYTTFDSIVAGKRDSWALFLGFPRDFSRAKVRNWVVDVWGAASAGSIAEAILQAGVEKATNAQSALGGTARTTGTVTALARAFTGSVDTADVNWLVNQA